MISIIVRMTLRSSPQVRIPHSRHRLRSKLKMPGNSAITKDICLKNKGRNRWRHQNIATPDIMRKMKFWLIPMIQIISKMIITKKMVKNTSRTIIITVMIFIMLPVCGDSTAGTAHSDIMIPFFTIRFITDMTPFIPVMDIMDTPRDYMWA